MSISADDVRAMARLARIAIDDSEISDYAGQLSSILDFVAQMNDVDTSAVVPLSRPQELPARYRPDEVTENDRREALQAGAPELEQSLYLVPRVVE